MTKDGTKLYLAKLVKDLVKDYKGNRDLICRSQYFSLKVVLMRDYIADIRVRDI